MGTGAHTKMLEKTGEFPRGDSYLWWLYILAILIIILILLLVMPVRADFLYQRQGADDLFRVKISSFGGLLNLNLVVPVVEQSFNWLKPFFRLVLRSRVGGLKLKEETILDPAEWSWERIKLWLKEAKWAVPIVKPGARYLLSKSVIRHLSWQTRLGTGDAAVTGMLAGLAWGLNSTLFAWLTHRVRKIVDRPKISVVPVFAASAFALDIHCIFEVRVGHIIIAGATAIRKIWQQRG